MKRDRILPFGTPDEPRRPAVEPMHVNAGVRARVCWIAGALLLAFWFGVAFAIGGGAWPW